MSQRLLAQIPPPRFLRGAALVAVAALLGACGTNTPSPSSAAVPSAPGSIAAEPSESAASSDAAEAPCLPTDLFAALQAIESVEVGPDLPAEELADAVEALDLSQFSDLTLTMQDELVSLLRAGEASTFAAQQAAGVLRQTTGMTEC